MLFTEGGEAMFAQMREQAASGHLSAPRFYTWVGRWVLNIAGFHGDQHGVGSAFLTASTAQAMFALLDELEALRRTPHRDVLSGYLRARAEMLHMADRPALVHLACLLKLKSPREGEEMMAWAERLPAADMRATADAYAAFRAGLTSAPTYAPALLNNLRDSGMSLAKVASLFTALEREARRLYPEECRGHAEAEAPLSYRCLAEEWRC